MQVCARVWRCVHVSGCAVMSVCVQRVELCVCMCTCVCTCVPAGQLPARPWRPVGGRSDSGLRGGGGLWSRTLAAAASLGPPQCAFPAPPLPPPYSLGSVTGEIWGLRKDPIETGLGLNLSWALPVLWPQERGLAATASVSTSTKWEPETGAPRGTFSPFSQE